MLARRMMIGSMTLAAVLAAPAAALAQQDLDPVRGAPRGSIARQLQIKAKLLAAAQGTTLVAMLDHNRAAWESHSPDQRESFRREARAFRAKDPKEQEEMIRRFDEWIGLAAERKENLRRMYGWVKVVAASFTPAEREEIRLMSANRRARAFILRRDALVKAGKLSLHTPATTRSR